MNESNYLHLFSLKNRTSWNPCQREEDVPILQTKLVGEILHHLQDHQDLKL